MVTTDLDDMLGIWDRWTDGDPILRHAVQGIPSEGTDRWALIDPVLQHLNRLFRLWTMGDVATSAALYAGWAVALALVDEDGAMAAMVRDLRRDAQEAHWYACAGGVPCQVW
jgi:hypothetical protein